jgi:hypothetical protein
MGLCCVTTATGRSCGELIAGGARRRYWELSGADTRASSRTGDSVEDVPEKDGVQCATLTLEPFQSAQVERGPYGGWY